MLRMRRRAGVDGTRSEDLLNSGEITHFGLKILRLHESLLHETRSHIYCNTCIGVFADDGFIHLLAVVMYPVPLFSLSWSSFRETCCQWDFNDITMNGLCQKNELYQALNSMYCVRTNLNVFFVWRKSKLRMTAAKHNKQTLDNQDATDRVTAK